MLGVCQFQWFELAVEILLGVSIQDADIHHDIAFMRVFLFHHQKEKKATLLLLNFSIHIFIPDNHIVSPAFDDTC